MNFILPKPYRRRPSKSAAAAALTSKPDYGLHTLVDRDPTALQGIDIVAIHGLNGHYLNTWTDEETGINWVEEHIHRIVPVSRVMSFWYNSTLQFSKSTSDVGVFSDQLLENLHAKRKSIEEQERPLIFICHSLGGLVFKKALVRAHENDEYLSLAKNMRGVFFFGTPHKGSSLANWSTMAARLLKVASMGTSTNTRLSKDLEPNSRMMECISDSFLAYSSNLKIVSCYETLKMDYLNAVVVEKDSAILDRHKDTNIPIESDHRGMCRFGDINEARFEPVKSRLDTMARNMRKAFSLDKDRLMKALNTSNYEAHKSRNPSPVPGTCTWIFNHPKCKSWIESRGPSLLWISADPGCGKSVLASFLVDHFTAIAPAKGLNVCYFFFKSDNVDQSDVVRGTQAILHQLYSQQKDLMSTDAAELQVANIQSVEGLWKAFVQSTQREDARPTICILDGIDECEPKPRGLLLRSISKYFATEEHSQVGTCRSRLRVIITSRPENQIKVALDKSSKPSSRNGSASQPRTYNMIRLRAEDETDAISADVARVIRAKIEDLIDHGLPAGLLHNLQSELVKRADRTFLWVSLVLDLLEEKVESGASRRELDEILKTRDIFGIYAELLASRPDLTKARKLLEILLSAARPLTVEETSIVLAVASGSKDGRVQQSRTKARRPGDLTFDDVEYELVYPFENHLKHLCGNFIRIIRDKVYFVHETAREFLLANDSSSRIVTAQAVTARLSSSLSNPPISKQTETFQHSFTLIDTHVTMLELCAAYLYCLAKPSSSSQSGETSIKTAPFLDYAAQCWTIHYHRARSRLVTRDKQYYQNLCHPLFHGFNRWMKAFWSSNPPPHPLSAPDEIHDYYIEFFSLETPLSSPGNEPSDGEGSHASSNDEPATEECLEKSEDSQDACGMTFCRPAVRGEKKSDGLLEFTSWRGIESSLSSNPASLSNHYFPLKVDGDGLVSLDFGSISSNHTTKC
ncbi:ankyrin repeat protein [Colletotrichum karsti]|uniref:Ankyrin repeat protein n=1 Tax=Colletotrichum karsti TaxID=1095194 RepID=A0A9P6I8A8_9PEZI|nr:ankyrin repeat protein [Colletotrichum karsti]KAF9879053.1 ankyrin repeat protein [Colletotrichum karsti]